MIHFKLAVLLATWLCILAHPVSAQRDSVSCGHLDEQIRARSAQLWHQRGNEGIAFADSVAAFRAWMGRVFENEGTWHHSFHRSDQYLSIRVSPDSLFRVISWDDFSTGTSWHEFAAMVQFRPKGGKCAVQFIDHDSTEPFDTTNAVFDDASVREVFALTSRLGSCYLLVANGTFGEGEWFSTARAFELSGDSLILRKGAFPMGNRLVIQAPRTLPTGLLFTPARMTISYGEFLFNDGTGFHEPTGKTLSLQWDGERFVSP